MITTANNTLTFQDAADGFQGGILRWLLAGAIASLPIQIETSLQFRFALSDVFLMLTLILGVGVWCFVRPAWSFWHVALLGLISLAVLTKAMVSEVAQTDMVNKLGGIILLLAFYVCITTLANTWGNITFFLRVFVISVTIQNTVACAAFLWCKQTGTTPPLLMVLLSGYTDRLAGMLVDPNAYGGLLAVAFAIVLLCRNPENPLLPGWFRVFSLMSLSMGLMLTSSRSAWLAVGVLAIFAVIQHPRLLLILPLLFVAGIGALAYSMGEEDFGDMVAISSRENTIDERLEINHNAWLMFLKHPIFGGGIGAFYEEHNIIVHNSAMWFLAEFGLVGFSIFAGLIAWHAVKGVVAHRNAPPTRRPIISGLLAVHIAMVGFSQGVEALYQRTWWFVMGLIAAAYVLTIGVEADETIGLDSDAVKIAGKTLEPASVFSGEIGLTK